MEIRPATVDDAAGIARVHVASWRATYRGHFPDDVLDGLSEERRAEGWRSAIERNPARSGLLIAEDGGVVGFSAFGASREDGPGVGEVFAIYLLPARIGTGVGRGLMERTLSALSGLGFSEAILWVLEENHHARHFYAAAGFEVDEWKVDDPFGFEISEVRYRRPLGRPTPTSGRHSPGGGMPRRSG